jgi:hypothetical protein
MFRIVGEPCAEPGRVKGRDEPVLSAMQPCQSNSWLATCWTYKRLLYPPYFATIFVEN